MYQIHRKKYPGKGRLFGDSSSTSSLFCLQYIVCTLYCTFLCEPGALGVSRQYVGGRERGGGCEREGERERQGVTSARLPANGNGNCQCTGNENIDKSNSNIEGFLLLPYMFSLQTLLSLSQRYI